MTTLKQKLAAGEFIAAPGIFDGISVRIAESMGFDALYMTGYGTVGSHLGLPDAGLASYRDMVDMIVALGKEYAGMFSNSDGLSDQLSAAGTGL